MQTSICLPPHLRWSRCRSYPGQLSSADLSDSLCAWQAAGCAETRLGPSGVISGGHGIAAGCPWQRVYDPQRCPELLSIACRNRPELGFLTTDTIASLQQQSCSQQDRRNAVLVVVSRQKLNRHPCRYRLGEPGGIRTHDPRIKRLSMAVPLSTA